MVLRCAAGSDDCYAFCLTLAPSKPNLHTHAVLSHTGLQVKATRPPRGLVYEGELADYCSRVFFFKVAIATVGQWASLLGGPRNGLAAGKVSATRSLQLVGSAGMMALR